MIKEEITEKMFKKKKENKVTVVLGYQLFIRSDLNLIRPDMI
jgi:hypothetical protein